MPILFLLLPIQEIQYTDIDYMEDKKDFTYDKLKFRELPQFADYLHAKGQKYILILVRSTSLWKKAIGHIAGNRKWK